MPEKSKLITHPHCVLCHGTGNININRVLDIKCPACHYYDWNPIKHISLTLKESDALRLRDGKAFHDIPYTPWTRQEGAYNDDMMRKRRAKEKADNDSTKP